MTIGEKIRQIRLQRGLSQENMADSLKISTSAYGDIERNKTELTIPRAKQIAEILQSNLLELLGLELAESNHQAEILQIENEKLKLEVEKLAFESLYWREKFEERVLTEVYSILAKQHLSNRRQIGFTPNP